MMVMRDFQNLKKRPPSNYFVIYGLENEDIMAWVIFLLGPPSTLYAGGVFRAILRFPGNFPMSPPSLQFTTSIWHPNIYRDGKVCITTLQTPPPDIELEKTVNFWRPVLGVDKALLSVVSLLSDPNADDPANSDAAREYEEEYDGFVQRCADLARRSRKEIPEDFVMPAVSSQPCATSTQTSEARNNFVEDIQYVYSDDDVEEQLTANEDEEESIEIESKKRGKDNSEDCHKEKKLRVD